MVPKQRQTLLFSATLTSALSQLHQVSVRKPYFYREAEDDSITVDRLDQRFVICPRAVRDVYLVYVVKNFCAKRNESSVIVFAASCRECHALSLTFKAMGFEVLFIFLFLESSISILAFMWILFYLIIRLAVYTHKFNNGPDSRRWLDFGAKKFVF